MIDAQPGRPPFEFLPEEQVAAFSPRQKMTYYLMALAELNRRCEELSLTGLLDERQAGG